MYNEFSIRGPAKFTLGSDPKGSTYNSILCQYWRKSCSETIERDIGRRRATENTSPIRFDARRKNRGVARPGAPHPANKTLFCRVRVNDTRTCIPNNIRAGARTG